MKDLKYFLTKSQWLETGKILVKEKGIGFLKVILINLVLSLVLVEGISLAYFFLKTNRLYYSLNNTDKDKEVQKVDVNLTGIRLDRGIVERLHPFFGYIMQPGPDFRPGFKVNSYGFISPYDYPLAKKNKNQYFIGVFGGSVAQNYSAYEIENNILAQFLKKLPQFKDKEIIILPFATGGYKQPQQLLILNYFLSLGQELDMVINIDGFNEIALSNKNNKNYLDVVMPSGQHIVPLANIANNSLSPKAMKALLKINEIKDHLKDKLKDLENCKFATCHVLTSLQIQNLTKNYRSEIKRFEKERRKVSKDSQNNVIYYNTVPAILEDKVAFEKMAVNWVNSSVLMNKILSSNGIRYFHILQPNQYYPTQRVFSDEEKNIAFNPTSDYGKAVKNGYPFLLKKIDELKQQQVKFLNGVQILDQSKDIVYVDDCCHYNETGERIFSESIAQFIVNELTQNQNSRQTPNKIQ